jgi:hypothetical protein
MTQLAMNAKYPRDDSHGQSGNQVSAGNG